MSMTRRLVIGGGVFLYALRRSATWTGGEPHHLPHLQLHFDINKTLLVSDPVGGKDTRAMVNSLLSEVVWGRVDQNTGEWNCISKRPSPSSPVPDDVSVMTFGEYLENVKLRRDPGDGSDENKKNNAAKKALTTKLKTHFTETGNAGENFHADFQNVMAHLELPPAAKAVADPDLFKNGQCAVLPSFFNLLLHLQREKRDFSLYFRTFGTELEQVATELNLFCNGQHPLFPEARADGTNGTRDFRIDLKRDIGSFVVTGPHSGEITLYLHTLNPQDRSGSGERKREEPGFPNIFRFFATRANRSWAIRDDYSYWARNHESDTSGKLLCVDPRNFDEHPIFFDDNVERDRAHIVRVVDGQGDPLPFSQTKGKFLVKAEPFLAITDPNYFVKALQACEEARRHSDS